MQNRPSSFNMIRKDFSSIMPSPTSQVVVGSQVNKVYQDSKFEFFKNTLTNGNVGQSFKQTID
jgi:hypothetical protein